MKNKLAIIIGVGGQDGKIMWKYLKSKNYNIIGIKRNNNIYHGIKTDILSTNILKKDEVSKIIKTYRPDEVYYFAAYHHSSQDIVPKDSILLEKSNNIHVNGYFNLLESILKYSNETKICYASSCLIYGGTNSSKQNELTLPIPNTIYGITKLGGMHLGKYFTSKYNLKIVNAILYNHESEYRSPKFLSMKIIDGAIKISKGLQDKITLGNINNKIDWGYAGDYIKAMHLLLENNKKGDYIISSGELHSIQEMIEIVFNYLQLDWKSYIITDNNIIQRNSGLLFGDNIKIKSELGWKAETGFKEMIIKMIESHKNSY